MSYFCDPDIPWYMTRGIASDMDPVHQAKCIELLENLKAGGTEPDYLQVFRFSYDAGRRLITVKHSQEQPEYENEVSYALGDNVRPFEGKVFMIDDIDHRTILLASEY